MAAISQEEYLKRYLSNADSGEKKRRKKKAKAGVKTGKSLIIDDDVNLSDIKVKNDSESHGKLLELADETPLIFNEAGTTVLSKDLESIRKKEEETRAMWAPLKNFQDETSEKKEQKQLNAKDFSLMRSNVRNARHDSPSPERSKINSKILKGQVNSSKTRVGNRKRHDSEDMSPQRRTRHDSSSDQSPTRQQTKDALPKHSRKDSPDLSPQRRNTKTRPHSTADQSPPRQTRHDSSSDQSPPRSRQSSRKNISKTSRNDSPDMSPPRNIKNARLRSPMDQSPPKQNRHDSSSDQSPPRTGRPSENPPKRMRHDSPDLSPRRMTKDRSIDQSPPRRQRMVDNKNQTHRRRHDSPPLSTNTRVSPPDQSPPRKQGGHQAGKRSFKTRHDDGDSPDQSPPRKQKNSERKTGLHSAAELKQENERTRQRENEMFARMQSSTTGKGAQTVHRDKTGRRRDFKVEEAKKREEEKKKEEENEKFMEWGKGVQQSKTSKDKVHDDLYEMSKPLARYKNDEDLDQMLKEKDRSGDPMLAFMQKKKSQQAVAAGKKEKPKYKGPAPPPNRFSIPPGYRWDGVDRSNGFEKKRFSMLANKGATREEAYKWSIEDM